MRKNYIYHYFNNINLPILIINTKFYDELLPRLMKYHVKVQLRPIKNLVQAFFILFSKHFVT